MNRRAKLGCTIHEIIGDSGHVTMDMIELYTKKFDRQAASDRACRKLIAND